MAKRRYYLLVQRDVLEDGCWTPQFGDYDKGTVLHEKEDYRKHAKASDLKVIITGASGRAVKDAVHALNNRTPTCRKVRK